MATKKEYRDYILDQLCDCDNIVCKPVMGEFLLYYNGVLFGGLYDNRLLVKITNNNEKYNLIKAIPYKNGREMYMIEDIDNSDLIKEIIICTYKDLK